MSAPRSARCAAASEPGRRATLAGAAVLHLRLSCLAGLARGDRFLMAAARATEADFVRSGPARFRQARRHRPGMATRARDQDVFGIDHDNPPRPSRPATNRNPCSFREPAELAARGRGGAIMAAEVARPGREKIGPAPCGTRGQSVVSQGGRAANRRPLCSFLTVCEGEGTKTRATALVRRIIPWIRLVSRKAPVSPRHWGPFVWNVSASPLFAQDE